MKKIFGVILAITLSLCLFVPSVAAANSSISDLLEGVDLGGLSQADLENILGELDLESLDIESLIGDSEALEDALLELGVEEETEAEAEETTAPAVGDVDLGWLTGLLSSEMDTSAFTEMFSDFEVSELGSLLGVISEAMGGAGVDLSSFDLSALGNFDITNVLSSSANLSGGSDVANVAMNATSMMAGIADTLKSGLSALGLDTGLIEGLLDNEIVNFFANMYIGFIGEVEESTTSATTKPAVVTTETPKTGDTSAVVVALATLTVASAAAFVCLKKKED